MFHVTDYNTFEKAWLDYLAVYNETADQLECRSLFCSIKDYAPCTFEQFLAQLKRSVILSTKKLSMPELMELASFDGRTKEQAKAVAQVHRSIVQEYACQEPHPYAQGQYCLHNGRYAFGITRAPYKYGLRYLAYCHARPGYSCRYKSYVQFHDII